MNLEQILSLVNGPLGQGAFGGLVMMAVFAILKTVIAGLRPKVLKTPTKADDIALDAVEAAISLSEGRIVNSKKFGGKL